MAQFHTARHPVIDWEKLREHGVHPSFSLPSSYHAVRAHVPPQSLREVCDKHPRHEYRHLCDREAVVIPVLLARPEGTNLDTQVYRAHVQNSRRYLGSSGTFSFKDTAEGEQLCRNSSEPTPKLDLKSTWQGLIDALRRSVVCCCIALFLFGHSIEIRLVGLDTYLWIWKMMKNEVCKTIHYTMTLIIEPSIEHIRTVTN